MYNTYTQNAHTPLVSSSINIHTIQLHPRLSTPSLARSHTYDSSEYSIFPAGSTYSIVCLLTQYPSSSQGIGAAPVG